MKILFVEPHASSIFSFRKELLDALIDERYEIVLCTEPSLKTKQEYESKVSKILPVSIDLKSKSFIRNLKLKKQYKKIINSVKPDLIISYKIKPNIYCAYYSKNIPIITNITGLGNIFKKKGLLSKIGLHLYKKSFKNVDFVFFQNTDGYDFFIKNKIPINKYSIIPGSGVNLDKFFPATEIDSHNSCVTNFLFASRAIKEKGFELLLNAIPKVIEKNNNVRFNFLNAEEDIRSNHLFNEIFSKYHDYISLLNRTDDMKTIYLKNDFLVSPSYYREGMSNVLLESLACGRPIITTIDNPGCMEVLQDEINGFGVKSNDLDSLIKALIKASVLSKDKIAKMGKAGREFVSNNFDRKIVVNKYLKVIKELIN